MKKTTSQNTNNQPQLILGVDSANESSKYKRVFNNYDLYLSSNTTEAKEVFEMFPVQVVVIQGNSRFNDNPRSSDPAYTLSFCIWLLQRDFRGPIFVVIDSSMTRLNIDMFKNLSPQIKVVYQREFFRMGSGLLSDSCVRSARETIEEHVEQEEAAEWLKRLDVLVPSFNGCDIAVVYHALVETGVGQPMNNCTEKWFDKNRGLANWAVRQLFHDHPDKLKSMREYLMLSVDGDPFLVGRRSKDPRRRMDARLLQILQEEPDWLDWFIWPAS